MNTVKKVLTHEQYEQDVIKKAKEYWFNEHEAKLKTYEDMSIIYWSKPNSWEYKVKYIISGGNIFISGDLGDAVYNWYNPNPLLAFKRFNLRYFNTKLTAFQDGGKYNFDQDLAYHELEEYFDQFDEDMDEEFSKDSEMYKEIKIAISESSSVEAFHGWMMVAFERANIDHDVMSDLWSLGQRLNGRLIGYWLGLQMALEQLEEKGVI